MLTRVKSIIGGCIVFGIFIGIFQNSRVHHQIINTGEVSNYHVQLYPDQVKISGHVVSFKGIDATTKQPIECFYFPQSDQEINELRDSSNKLQLTVNGEIKKPDLPTNENQFNYRQYLRSQNIEYILTIKHLNSIVDAQDHSIDAKLHLIRNNLEHCFDQFPTQLKNYSKTLILGVVDDDFQMVINQIKQLGLLYLFCLSGLHVFFIRKYIMLILQLIHLSDELIDLILLIILPIYWVIGGNSLSLSRAIWMVWISIFSSLFLRHRFSGIESWGIVLIGYLMVYPMMFCSLGARLSYLMTFVILIGQKCSTSRLSFKLNNYSLPLILNSSYQWNLLTSCLSIIVGWFFEKVIFPITVIGVFIPFSRNLVDWLLTFFNYGFVKLGTLPTMITFGKLPFQVCLAIIGILLSLEYRRFVKVKILLLIILYATSYLTLHFPLQTEVTYFDIGQGDTTLIRTPFNRKVMLIDTGGKPVFNNKFKPDKQKRTAGQNIIANYLLSKGITHIDALYLTHQDADHVGYFPSIGKEIQYRRIVVPAGMEQLQSFKQRLDEMEQHPQIIPVTNQSQDPFFQILHPFQVGKGKNEDSLVLYYKIDQYRFLFTGDLDQKGELAVLGAYPNLRVDVLKNGHHGSRTSSNPEFIDKIKPRLAIISAGRNNRYHHPNQETLQTLQERNIPYYITARSGMIKIEIKDHQIKLKEWAKEFQ